MSYDLRQMDEIGKLPDKTMFNLAKKRLKAPTIKPPKKLSTSTPVDGNDDFMEDIVIDAVLAANNAKYEEMIYADVKLHICKVQDGK